MPTIYVNTSNVGQIMEGFGASLTDASAELFASLKKTNLSVYNNVLDTLFNQRTGMNILRVPIGTSDFSPDSLQYTMADLKGHQAYAKDTVGPLSNFNMIGANRYIIPFVKDALKRNSQLKLHLLPWSPPAWMKASNSVNGGSLNSGSTNVLAEYLVKSVQGFQQTLGVVPYSLSVQNEPTYEASYPSMSMASNVQTSVLALLRGRLAQVGLGGVRLWGLEDNFINWPTAVDLIRSNQSSLDGIAWHCYHGAASLLSSYHSALAKVPGSSTKSLHMTECTSLSTTFAFSTGLTWWMKSIFSQPALGVSSITTWNLALDSQHGPRLSRAVCTDCTGAILIDNGKVTANLQSLLLSHHASATADLSRFGGSPASKVASSVSNDTKRCLSSTLAFAARWSKTSQSRRIGVVVQNTCSTPLSANIALNNATSFGYQFGSGVTTIVLTV